MRPTTWYDTMRIGLFLWNKMTETYQDTRFQGEDGVYCFVYFVGCSIAHNDKKWILSLYNNFSANGRKYFEHIFCLNCLDHMVFKLLP